MGTFSEIELAQTDAGRVAIKKYVKNHGVLVQRHHQRELWALKHLSLPSASLAHERHVIFLIEAYSKDMAHYLMFPHYAYSLADVVSLKGKSLARSAMYQIAQGLDYLHSEGIVHCDLSPSNILVDVNHHMVITDFGCAHAMSFAPGTLDDMHDEIGTRFYKAPEHLFGDRHYGASTDVWSLGVIFAELLMGEPLFPGEGDIEQVGLIVKALDVPSPAEFDEMSKYPDVNKLKFFSKPRHAPSLADTLTHHDIDPKDQDILQRTLTWSVTHRLSVTQILQDVHPMLK